MGIGNNRRFGSQKTIWATRQTFCWEYKTTTEMRNDEKKIYIIFFVIDKYEKVLGWLDYCKKDCVAFNCERKPCDLFRTLRVFYSREWMKDLATPNHFHMYICSETSIYNTYIFPRKVTYPLSSYLYSHTPMLTHAHFIHLASVSDSCARPDHTIHRWAWCYTFDDWLAPVCYRAPHWVYRHHHYRFGRNLVNEK